jgi:hypothetical protein
VIISSSAESSSVAGDLQRQRVIVPERAAEGPCRGAESCGVGEVQPDVRPGSAALELLGAPGGDHLAVAENGDPVGELVRLVQLLGGQEDGDAAGHKLADGLPHHAAAARVETGGRLIEEDDARAADQGHRQAEQATHAAGVGRRRLPGRVGQVEPVEQPGGAPPPFGPAQVVQVRHQQQVLLAGEQVVDRGELAGDPDRRPYRRRVPGHVKACEAHLAAVGVHQRRHDLHGGGLAGAVGTQLRERRSAPTSTSMPSRTALPPNDLRSPVAVIALVMLLLSPSPRPGRPRTRPRCTQRDSSRFHGGFIRWPGCPAIRTARIPGPRQLPYPWPVAG